MTAYLYPCSLCDGHHSTRVCPVHRKKIAPGFEWARIGPDAISAGSQFGFYTVTRTERFNERTYGAEYSSHAGADLVLGSNYVSANQAKAACEQHDWEMQNAKAGAA